MIKAGVTIYILVVIILFANECEMKEKLPKAMTVKSIEGDAEFQDELSKAGSKLVVVDFTATWCGPCRQMDLIFQQLSVKYVNAIFIKIDIDKSQDIVTSQGVKGAPTFIIYRLKTEIGRVKGADPAALDKKIKQFYSEGEGTEEEGIAEHKGKKCSQKKCKGATCVKIEAKDCKKYQRFVPADLAKCRCCSACA